MIRLPDAATLDALVIGAHDPSDAAAWEALVLRPGGAEAWSAAMARRRRLDVLAGAARGRPWLARAVRAMTTVGRRMRRLPNATLTLERSDQAFQALAGGMLAAATEEDAEAVQPVWGQVVPVQVRVGESITLGVTPGEVPLDVRYLCNGEEGPLPGRAWKLEQGEAPVLILALAPGFVDEPLAVAMENATAHAGILIVAAD